MRVARALLATCSALLTLLAVEAGSRAKAWYDDRELSNFRALGTEPVINDPRAKLRTKHIVRLSGNDRIIFELIPGVTGSFRGSPLAVNSAGFRGPVLPETKLAGTVRIAGIGDSVMFGWGVREAETYLARLSARLAHDYPDVAWEWVNSGVPGYNTAMEVETLKHRLVAYEPDLVVVGVCNNDLDLPSFIRNERAYLTLGRSYLYTWARGVIKGLARPPDDRLQKASRVEDPPEMYRDLAGVDAYRRSMQELTELAAAHDFSVVLFTHARLRDELRSMTNEFGLPMIEGQNSLEAYMEEYGIEEYIGSVLTLNDDDPHPSPLGHELAMNDLYDYLRKAGIVDDLREKALASRREATRAEAAVD